MTTDESIVQFLLADGSVLLVASGAPLRIVTRSPPMPCESPIDTEAITAAWAKAIQSAREELTVSAR